MKAHYGVLFFHLPWASRTLLPWAVYLCQPTLILPFGAKYHVSLSHPTSPEGWPQLGIRRKQSDYIDSYQCAHE